jgi:sulfur relay (sulfurtransferase) DsrC/TusE family protein
MKKKRTNIYLSEEDKQDIAFIQKHYGHEDMASAVRFAVRKVAREGREHVPDQTREDRQDEAN